MKPKVKDDHNVLQMMTTLNQLPWMLQRIARVFATPFNKINGDFVKNENGHKEVI